jgi:2-amino-4-hydroxy-6-hydroxymethyldihydropteridine diphosphokinase/dihydropteroate synthase
MTKIALGLGSNLGNREQNLSNAIAKLSAIISDIQTSSILNNKAMLLPESPREWDTDFLNCVITGESDLTPEELLRVIKDIEHEIGRVYTDKKWAPRVIDIDILVYGNLHLEKENLMIPHSGLLERSFAIGLLAEIWPDWEYPVSGEFYQKTALELAKRLPK